MNNSKLRIILFCFVLLAALIGGFVWYNANISERRPSEQEITQVLNAKTGEGKTVGFAIETYLYDHGDRFPQAGTWREEIKPYLDPELQETLSAYEYSPAMSGKKFGEAGWVSETIVLRRTEGLPKGYVIQVYADSHVECVRLPLDK